MSFIFKKGITAKTLRSVLRYEPKTGFWFWIKPHYKRIKPGIQTALPDKSGRCHICYKMVQYEASRLAWLYMTGRWPKRLVDHKNRNHSDNRWKNLRLATLSQNCANSIRRYKNSSGFRGVFKVGNGYVVRVGRDYVGCFKTPEEGYAAYLVAAKKKYGAFANV